MQFFPTESRTALNYLGHFIDAKLAKLKQGSAIETERFRQAQYLKWCKQKFIPDPCGEEPGYERVVACFVENLILDCNPRSKTVLGYVQSINKLFEYRGFTIPADLSDKENITSNLIHAREREEGRHTSHTPGCSKDICPRAVPGTKQQHGFYWITFRGGRSAACR